jgi:hypothetical protein
MNQYRLGIKLMTINKTEGIMSNQFTFIFPLIIFFNDCREAIIKAEEHLQNPSEE